jgi:hypothetical protein
MGGKKRESKDDLRNRLNLKIVIVVHIFKITGENNGKYNKRYKGTVENFDRDNLKKNKRLESKTKVI